MSHSFQIFLILNTIVFEKKIVLFNERNFQLNKTQIFGNSDDKKPKDLAVVILINFYEKKYVAYLNIFLKKINIIFTVV